MVKPFVCTRAIIVLAISVCLSACVNNTPAPVVDLSRDLLIHPTEVHYVQRGETLYSIAWLYDMDYLELAQINHLDAPYGIYHNQRIFLSPKFQSLVAKPKNDPAPTSKASKPNLNNELPKQAKATPNKEVKPTTYLPAKKTIKLSTPTQWVWPTKGTIKNYFSIKKGYKGIDIIGKIGQPVRSVANGVVVYSGRGLIGYGNLIIVKHDENYLSAYAHNKDLLVKEGHSVRQGQIIARMGSKRTGEALLHFELRKKGKPVDPLGYLMPL